MRRAHRSVSIPARPRRDAGRRRAPTWRGCLPRRAPPPRGGAGAWGGCTRSCACPSTTARPAGWARSPSPPGSRPPGRCRARSCPPPRSPSSSLPGSSGPRCPWSGGRPCGRSPPTCPRGDAEPSPIWPARCGSRRGGCARSCGTGTTTVSCPRATRCGAHPRPRSRSGPRRGPSPSACPPSGRPGATCAAGTWRPTGCSTRSGMPRPATPRSPAAVPRSCGHWSGCCRGCSSPPPGTCRCCARSTGSSVGSARRRSTSSPTASTTAVARSPRRWRPAGPGWWSRTGRAAGGCAGPRSRPTAP